MGNLSEDLWNAFLYFLPGDPYREPKKKSYATDDMIVIQESKPTSGEVTD